jgi:hypothetical protein
MMTTIFEPGPEFDLAFICTLRFTRVQTIADNAAGITRSAAYVDEGRFEGPLLRGRAVPASGGDYATWRPDDTASLDARYMLEAEDGTLIYLQSRGYIWGRSPGVMDRLRRFAFQNGPAVPVEDYYFRTITTFETPRGKHDWLARHVFVGLGERRADGNTIRYFKLD